MPDSFAAGERHNLAEDPSCASVVLKLERAIMRWMVETSDYVPFELDPRFPDVGLETTRTQVERRLGKFNH